MLVFAFVRRPKMYSAINSNGFLGGFIYWRWSIKFARCVLQEWRFRYIRGHDFLCGTVGILYHRVLHSSCIERTGYFQILFASSRVYSLQKIKQIFLWPYSVGFVFKGRQICYRSSGSCKMLAFAIG